MCIDACCTQPAGKHETHFELSARRSPDKVPPSPSFLIIKRAFLNPNPLDSFEPQRARCPTPSAPPFGTAKIESASDRANADVRRAKKQLLNVVPGVE